MNHRGVCRKPLREIALQSSHVYGPVNSRRLGRSLGINPLPLKQKICTFDCLYCQYVLEKPVAGRESISSSLFPSESVILAQLESAVRASKGDIDFLTFSGNGEPTLHPAFPRLVRETVRLRDRFLPETGVALLSNSTTICDAEIAEAIKVLDKPIMKLDAGSEELWMEVNRPRKGADLEAIVSTLAGMNHVIIQSLFFAGDGSCTGGNISADDIASWLKRMERIRPLAVQLYTLDRTPAMPGLDRAPEVILEEIQTSLEGRGITARIY